MGLIIENLRDKHKEQNFVNDSSVYSTRNASWTVLKSYSGAISLAEAALILINFDYVFKNESASAYASAVRVKIDDGTNTFLVAANTYKSGTAEHTYNTKALAFLPAGTYNVTLEGKSQSSTYAKIKNIKIGKCSLADFVGYQTELASLSLSDNGSGTVISKTVTPPSSRKTCLGDLNKAFLCVYVCARVQSEDALIKFKNPGQTSEGYTLKLFIDGVQVSWIQEMAEQEQIAGGALASYICPVTLGENHTVEVKAVNKTGATRTVEVYITVVLCPWLLPYNMEKGPIDLDVSYGSTIYIGAEPLHGDPTKNLKLGVKKAIPRDSDYFASVSGTGKITLSETLDINPPEATFLYVNGYGGVIDRIGVDVR